MNISDTNINVDSYNNADHPACNDYVADIQGRLTHVSRMDNYENPERWRDVSPEYDNNGQ